MAGRIARWGLALGLCAVWWWAVLRLALTPHAGALEGAVAAGGWGLSLLPVHCMPKARAVGAVAAGRWRAAWRGAVMPGGGGMSPALGVTDAGVLPDVGLMGAGVWPDSGSMGGGVGAGVGPGGADSEVWPDAAVSLDRGVTGGGAESDPRATDGEVGPDAGVTDAEVGSVGGALPGGTDAGWDDGRWGHAGPGSDGR